MLCELHVTNLVIVAAARLEMGEGLTVISGETGAGKSLLLDALDLLLGGRGSARLVGPVADHAHVSGVFQVEAAIADRLTATGIDSEDGMIILRRRLTRSGRSQAWINDTPVPIATLKAVGSQLVDIRVQHEHLRLADVGRQLELIDRFGHHEKVADEYRTCQQRCGDLARKLVELQDGDSDSLKELDYLRFLHRELEELNPVEGELDELAARQQLLAGAQHWQELAGQASMQLIESDDAIQPLLSRLGQQLAEAPQADLAGAGQTLLQAAELVQDAGRDCAGMVDSLAADPAELQRVDDRLARWHDLVRKHGGSEAELFAAWSHIADRIAWLDGLDERRAALVSELAASEAERVNIGRKLATKRRAAVKKLAKGVHAELAELGMPKARLSLHEGEERATELGLRQQELHIATNPGLPAGPLADVASGGEAARMTLAMAVVLAEQDETPVLVFDEVDSGVGGRLGQVMGDKLALLGRGRSVLAVTHTPQLAAAADQHFIVRKQQADDGTAVEVLGLTGDARMDELADMLGGGKAALEQARVLLTGSDDGAAEQ